MEQSSIEFPPETRVLWRLKPGVVVDQTPRMPSPANYASRPEVPQALAPQAIEGRGQI